jgi:hypothetical protein
MGAPALLVVILVAAVCLKPSFGAIDYSAAVEHGNYTCDELVRWLGTEKHYSNPKKDILFSLMNVKECANQPVLLLRDVSYGWPQQVSKRTFFVNSGNNNLRAKQCEAHDDYAVTYLSNFSINNNFSHFLHGLLRLFCALTDAGIIKWDANQDKFIQTRNYTIWLDEYFKLSPEKAKWLEPFGATLKQLSTVSKGSCVSSSKLLYGSGCVRLLPPEKWFGYPGCRAGEILPAFSQFMRQKHSALNAKDLMVVDEPSAALKEPGIRVAYAVRDVGAETGMRAISNLEQVQALIRRTQHVRSSMENVTFEHLDVPSTIRYMAGVHIFVSVHGAGMTNMFFMNLGSAVVEIIPYPLCNCRAPDYFYGIGGYYHGSAVAQGIKHYPYCVPAQHVTWHEKPADARDGAKCNWKHLHAVQSVYVDPTLFVSLMRQVERDLVVAGTVQLTHPIINVSPHANG